MYSELQITFRGVLPSEAVRDLVREAYGEARGRFACSSCEVAIERAQDGSPESASVCARIELRDAEHGTKIFVQARERDALSAVREVFARISGVDAAPAPHQRGSSYLGYMQGPALALVH